MMPGSEQPVVEVFREPGAVVVSASVAVERVVVFDGRGVRLAERWARLASPTLFVPMGDDPGDDALVEVLTSLGTVRIELGPWVAVPIRVGSVGTVGAVPDASGWVAVGEGPWVVRGRVRDGGRVEVGGAQADVPPGGRFTLPVGLGPHRVSTPDGAVDLQVELATNPGSIEIIDVRWPVDIAGRPQLASRTDTLTLAPDWLRESLGFFGGAGRADDPDVPWTMTGVRLRNTGAVERSVVVLVEVQDSSGAIAPGFATRVRDTSASATSARVAVPPFSERVAVLPVTVQRDALVAGDWNRQVEVWAPGGIDPLVTRVDPIRVGLEGGRAWVTLGVGGLMSLVGLGFITTGLAKRVQQWRRVEFVVIGLLSALGLVHAAGAMALGMGLASVLGPFAPFVLGVVDDAVRTALMAVLLTWVPRVGAATVWLALGALLRLLTLGSVHPVELLYLGAAVACTEPALWVFGVTRRGFADLGFVSRWLRLGLALAGPGVALSLLSMAVTVTMYRMDLHPAYVVALALGPGGLYVVLAVGPALVVADRLRAVAP